MSICFWPTPQTITAGANSSSPTPISYTSQWVVAFVNGAGGAGGFCELPSGVAIGDVVEIHGINNNSAITVKVPSGETFGNNSKTTTPVFFRKVDTTVWDGI